MYENNISLVSAQTTYKARNGDHLRTFNINEENALVQISGPRTATSPAGLHQHCSCFSLNNELLHLLKYQD